MLAKPALFLSSYAPLFFMLALRFEAPCLRLVCVGLGVLGVVALVWFFSASRSARLGDPRKVASVTNAGAAASAYLAGYLLPFLALPQPKALDLLAYGLFFLVAYPINAKTGLLQVNPLVFMLPGRSLQMITFGEGDSCLVVTRGRVREGDEIRLRAVGNEDIYVMAAR
jgi:hypothetical protein